MAAEQQKSGEGIDVSKKQALGLHKIMPLWTHFFDIV